MVIAFVKVNKLLWEETTMGAPLWLLRCAGVHVLIAIGFFLSTGDASATLVSTLAASTGCGGDSFMGAEAKWTVTDPAGDVFTLNCVNREYYQGSIFVKSTGKTTEFGRCIYEWGANIINYEVDAKDNFKEIEWVNVKPLAPNAASRNAIITALDNGAFADVNKPTDPTDKWLDKVTKYLKDNTLENTDTRNDKNIIYKFPFSPNDQEIDGFQNDTLETEFVLTPDQANLSYLDDGLSPIPNLVIDPLMRVPGASEQEVGIPEPDTLFLVVSALASIIALRRRRLC
jgi:hypothetical protein